MLQILLNSVLSVISTYLFQNVLENSLAKNDVESMLTFVDSYQDDMYVFFVVVHILITPPSLFP